MLPSKYSIHAANNIGWVGGEIYVQGGKGLEVGGGARRQDRVRLLFPKYVSKLSLQL